jgi:hypothetical protein
MKEGYGRDGYASVIMSLIRLLQKYHLKNNERRWSRWPQLWCRLLNVLIGNLRSINEIS